MGKIIFYEDKSFWGHCYECSSDHLVLRSCVKQCNSIQVEKGSWMICENPNYSGHQYFLKRGDHPDFQKWFSLCDSIRSCHVILQITFFEDRDFEGGFCEATTDQPDLRAHLNRCNSIKVETGCWMIYECPNYIGHQHFLKKEEYPDYQHWMGFNDSIRSCCIITAASFLYCLHVCYCLY